MKKHFLKFLFVCISLSGLIFLNSLWKPEEKFGLIIYGIVFWICSGLLLVSGYRTGKTSAKKIFPFVAIFLGLVFILIFLEHFLFIWTAIQ